MDFRDSNGAAAGNAIRAGNSFWNNLTSLRQQNAQLPGEIAKSRQQKAAADVAEATIPNQIQQSNDVTAQGTQKTQAGARAGSLDIKNMYLNTVTPPDVRDKFIGKSSNPFSGKSGVYPGLPPALTGILSSIPTDSSGNIVDHNAPFSQQPSEVQQEMVNRVVAHKPDGSAAITPAEAKAALAMREFQENNATVPPITPYSLPGGLTIDKLSGGPAGTTWEASNPGVQPILDPNTGARTGFVKAQGEIKPDPMALAPKEQLSTKEALANVEQSQADVAKIQDLIGKNPSLVGRGITSGGSAIPRIGREVKSYFSNSPSYGQQKQLQMFLGNRLLDVLGQVHIGRVTELEWNQLKNNIPTQDSPKEVWDDYLNRLNTALGKSRQDQIDQLKSNGTPSASLPGVGNPRASQVVSPGSHRVGDSEVPGSTAGGVTGAGTSPTITTKAEFDALQKGQSFIWKGKRGVK